MDCFINIPYQPLFSLTYGIIFLFFFLSQLRGNIYPVLRKRGSIVIQALGRVAVLQGCLGLGSALFTVCVALCAIVTVECSAGGGCPGARELGVRVNGRVAYVSQQPWCFQEL